MYSDLLGRKYPLCLACGGDRDTISQISVYVIWWKTILDTETETAPETS